MGFFDKIAKLLLGEEKKESKDLQEEVLLKNDVEGKEKPKEEKKDKPKADLDGDKSKDIVSEIAENDKSQDISEEEKSEAVDVVEEVAHEVKEEVLDAQPTPKQEKKVIKVVEDNPIQKQDKILKNILAIAQDYKVNHVSVENKALIVNVTDQILFDILKNNSFVDNIKRKIYDQEGLIFGNGVELFLKSEVNSLWKEVYSGVYAEVREGEIVEEKNEIARKASIKVFDNSGSFMQEEYILDSDEIKNLPQNRYNIGLGAEVMTSDNRYRMNQIALDNNPGSPFFENNKYVSRAHANIRYNEKYGFLLYVETGGTTLGGHRTRIYRGGTEIKLESPINPEPLKDYDIIELSKKVKILFKIVKE